MAEDVHYNALQIPDAGYLGRQTTIWVLAFCGVGRFAINPLHLDFPTTRVHYTLALHRSILRDFHTTIFAPET
jgi:hypothetical protein